MTAEDQAYPSHPHLTRQTTRLLPEEQFGQILALLGENSKGIAELKSSMLEIRSAKEEIESWKPVVDHRVADLEKAVNQLGDRVEKFFTDKGKLTSSSEEVFDPSSHSAPASSTAGAEKASGSAHLEPPPFGATSGLKGGHREQIYHRSSEFGVVFTTTLDPTPVTGAMNLSNSPRVKYEYNDRAPVGRHSIPSHHPAMPDLPFPKFDGTNPKLWIRNCETFYDVYEVSPRLWIRYATMHLTGSAALWYQTFQTTVLAMNWDDFCATVCAKFDRDEHNHLLRHFFHIRQTHFVHEYIEQFCDLVHQLLAHDPTIAPVTLTNRFVDGLKKEIKSVVMMHRPPDLDSACSLALL